VNRTRVKWLADWVFGFALLFPIFIQIENGFGIYSGGFASEGLSIPIGYIASVVFLLANLRVVLSKKFWTRLESFISVLVVLYFFFLSMYSMQISGSAFLYFIQWAFPFVLFAFFNSTIFEKSRFEPIISGIKWGVLVALIEIFASFLLELVTGSFSGRIVQNKFFIGMYQLYSYMPLALTIGALWLIIYYCGDQQKKSILDWGVVALLLFLSLFALVVTGVRGPVALFAVAVLLYSVSYLRRGVVIFGSGVFLALIIGVLMPHIDVNFMLVDKLWSAVTNSEEYGGIAGNRGAMIDAYWNVFLASPLIGSGLLPPWIAFPELGVRIKSAHNYYVDILSWSGVVGAFLVFSLFLTVFYKSCFILVNFQRSGLRSKGGVVAIGAAILVIALFLVSNNLRVPFRQPYVAPLIALLMAAVFHGYRVIRAKRSVV